MRLFDKTMTVMEKSLDAYADRSKLIANNVANVNTPYYKRQDIQFEEILSEALNEDSSSKIEGKMTNSGHIAINAAPALDDFSHVVITEENTYMRNDGNNVDIEHEMAENAENNIRYQTAINRVSGSFALLKSVIRGK